MKVLPLACELRVMTHLIDYELPFINYCQSQGNLCKASLERHDHIGQSLYIVSEALPGGVTLEIFCDLRLKLELLDVVNL